MTERFPRDALVPLAGTFAIQIVVSGAMFGVAVITPVAAPDVGVTPTLIGAYMAVAYGIGMVAGLVTGPLSRRFGLIPMCQATMVLVLLGTLVLAIGSPGAVMLSAVVLGASYGPVNPLTTDILASVASDRWRPLIISIKQTGMPAGAAVAGLSLPYLSGSIGWQGAMVLFGIVALTVALLVHPLSARFARPATSPEPFEPRRLLSPCRLIWENKRLRRLGIAGFLFAGCQVSIASYFVVFVTGNLALSLGAAGALYTVLQLSGVAGRLASGSIAGWIASGAAVLSCIAIGSAAMTLLAGLAVPASPLWLLAAGAALLGVTSHGWNGVYYAEVAKIAPNGLIGDAASGVQFTSLAGVASIPPLFGLIAYTAGYPAAFVAVAMGLLLGGWTLRPWLSRPE